MTYQQFKNLVSVYLTGDNVLSPDNDKVLAGLESAFIELSNKATAMKLLTANKNEEIIRQDISGLYVRLPKLPTKDTDTIDIDSELVPAAARIVASYFSKEKGGMHMAKAFDLIRDYEGKVA